MHIKSSDTLTHAEGKHSWTIRADMGVVKHFPTRVCEALIDMGAEQVARTKSAKAVKAKPAE